jgi:hypothetical protein
VNDEHHESAASGEEKVQAATFFRDISSRTLYKPLAIPQSTIGCNSMIECSLCGGGCDSLASCSGSSLSELGLGYSGLTLYPRPLSTPMTSNTARANIHPNPQTQPQVSAIQGSITDPEENTRVSTFGLREGLPSRAKDTIVAQSSVRRSRKMRMFLEDVNALIKDTNDALNEVGVALADAKAATKLWRATTPPNTISSEEADSQRALPVVIHSSATVPNDAAKKPLGATQTQTRATVPGARYQSKIEKKKRDSTILKKFQRTERSSNESSERMLPKWNISDVFSVKGLSKKFRGIEADELLTPERLQQIKQGAVTENSARKSSDSARSNDSATTDDTPSDPFHLEELSSRLDAAKRQRSLSPESKQRKLYLEIHSLIDELTVVSRPEETTLVDDHELPPPTSTEASLVPAHLRTNIQKESNPTTIVLPTIQELSPFDFSTTCFPYNTPSQSPTVASGHEPASKFVNKKTPLPQNDQKNTYLPSTLYTRLSPNFLQGPIQISKSSIEARRLENKYTSLHTMWEEAEPVDWTAFQMATLGNSLPENVPENNEEEDDRDDLCEWWEALAVGPPGKLVTEQDKGEPEDESLASSGILGVDEIAKANVDRGVKERTEEYVRELQELSSTFANSAPSLQNQAQHRKPQPFDWGHHNRAELDSTSTTVMNSPAPDTPGSLPPSPMFDLAAPNESKLGKVEQTRVPMGFNLGHDLGDYLNWETRHVPAEENPLEDDIYGA